MSSMLNERAFRRSFRQIHRERRSPIQIAVAAALAGLLGTSPSAFSQDTAFLTPLEMAEFLSGSIGNRSLPSADMLAQPRTLVAELILMAVVNGTRTSEMLMVGVWSNGDLTTDVGSLRAIRLKLDPNLSDDAKISFSMLPGVEVRYEPSDQTVHIDAPDDLLEAITVGLGGRRAPISDFDAIQGSPGALLNYGVYANDASGSTQVSGDLEAVAMSRMGIFATTAVWRGNQDDSSQIPSLVRLDSSWRFIDAEKVRSYTVGDFATNAVYGASSVRLGGFQYASAFDQRPDLVTTPLAQFSGSAALPSTLDVYLSQQKVLSTNIPSGPFNVEGASFSTSGNYRIVTTDITGRVVELEQSLYFMPGQLAQGMLQFSVDVGAPRLNYGRSSSDYDNTLFASGSARYGLTNAVTIQGHTELAEGLTTIGGGVMRSLGRAATLLVSASGSNYEERRGGQLSIQAMARLGAPVTIFGRAQRTTEDYLDLARLSGLRAREKRASEAAGLDPALVQAGLISTAYASTIYSAGLSFKPWFDSKSSFAVSHSRVESESSYSRTTNLSYSRRLTNRIDLTASAFTRRSANGAARGGVDDDDDYGGLLSLRFRFGNRLYGGAAMDRVGDQTAYTTQISSSGTGPRQNIGWGLRQRQVEGGDDQYGAYASYAAPWVTVSGTVSEANGDVFTSGQARGALVFMDKRLFATSRVGDSFAIVEGAGPHVGIRQNGALIATTNKNGDALLPLLMPYLEHEISVDTANLPEDWTLPETERRATVGYRQGTIVRFNAGPSYGAVLILHDAAGAVIPLGHMVELDTGQTGYVGHDGRAYVTGLQPHNTFTIDRGAAGICEGSFDYDVNGPAQPTIGPIVCK